MKSEGLDSAQSLRPFERLNVASAEAESSSPLSAVQAGATTTSPRTNPLGAEKITRTSPDDSDTGVAHTSRESVPLPGPPPVRHTDCPIQLPVRPPAGLIAAATASAPMTSGCWTSTRRFRRDCTLAMSAHNAGPYTQHRGRVGETALNERDDQLNAGARRTLTDLAVLHAQRANQPRRGEHGVQAREVFRPEAFDDRVVGNAARLLVAMDAERNPQIHESDVRL